jgi:tetratricopeptide (TPR) repeat protein
VGIGVYSNTFRSSFHFDDYHFILENRAIENIANLADIWNFWPSRFITFFSFALNYHFNQFDVFGYHLVNFIIHLGASICIFWLLRLTFLTPAMNKEEQTLSQNIIALLGGLVFLTHPIQTEAVTYIYQRSTSLAAFFYLLSLCLYVKSRILQQNKASVSSRRIMYAFSWIFGACAMFTKENALTLPFMLILYELFFLKIKKVSYLIRVIPFLFLMPVIAFLLYLKKMPTSHDLFQFLNYSAIAKHYLLTQPSVFWTYLRLTILPLHQNLDYNYPVTITPGFSSLMGILFIAGLLALTLRLFRRFRLVSFGICFFILSLLPESSIIPLEDIIFEHRLYLPIAGFCFFMAGALFYLLIPSRRKMLIAASVLLIISYSVLTFERNKVWKNEFSLWSDVISKSPGKARGYLYLCSSCLEVGKNDEAIPWCNKALQIDPLFPRANYNLGNAYANIGKNKEAIEAYRKEIKINPGFLEAYNNLAALYTDSGKVEEAIGLWSMVVQINPDFVTAHFNLAQFYFRLGRYDLAIRHCDEVTKRGYEVDSRFLKLLQPYRNK